MTLTCLRCGGPVDVPEHSEALAVCRKELLDALDDTEKLIREQAETVALLRELNDELKIAGWLQARVDAVLDKADAK